MTDWPDAPRLSETLNRLADEVETDPVRRTAVQKELAAREAQGYQPDLVDHDDGGPIAVIPFRPGSKTTARRMGPLLIAAAAIVIVGLVAVLIARDPDQSATVTSDIATTAAPSTPAPTTAAPPPELDRDDLCQEGGLAPTARLVATSSGDVEIGVARSENATVFDDLTILSVGSTPGWTTNAAEQRLEATSGLSDVTVFYMPAGLDATSNIEVVDSIQTEKCGFVVVYLITDGPVGDEVTCHEQFSERSAPAYSGFGLLEPGPPPSACQISRPTAIVERTSGPAVGAAWAEHLGCSRPTTDVDASGNEITRFAECDVTLVIARTSETDVWATTFDGLPTAEFLAQAMTTAN